MWATSSLAKGDRPAVPTLTTARTPAETAPADAYTARHLSVLEGLEAVRKRPGMYIGSTDSRGLQHCLGEIFDNAVDEALAGHCTGIEVTLHADGSAEVRDNGRGIPVDVERKTKLTGVELVMTRLHAGGKFGGGSYTASGGLHGVGASVVNALAARLDVEVDREGHTWAASFRRGVTGQFAGPGPDADFTRKSGLRQLSKVSRAAGDRDQDQVLAGPAGVHLRRQVQLRRAHRAGQADGLPGARPDHQHPRGAPRGTRTPTDTQGTPKIPKPDRSRPGARCSASTAASASSARTSAPARRSPTCCG